MKRFGTTLLFLLASSLVFPSLVSANQGVAEKAQTSEIGALLEAYVKVIQAQDFGQKLTDVQAQEKRAEIDALKAATKAFILTRMNEEAAKAENAKRVVYWSNFSANLTFGIAHVLLLFGLIAAAMEFRNARKLRTKGSKESSIDFEVKFESLALKSSTFGVLILFVSLLFYFMYLKFAYPVIVI
ncbi:MAG TPA: hypothetical protein VFX97_16515 [Pyrinomonadaceae bacterium]|nr:hypothetical protein [Pyrinomonadaceae bacterium]